MTDVTTAGDPTDRATAELACPLCGYSLRGLTEPRCPECGFAFTWGELLDAKRDRQPWLFEHGRGWAVQRFLGTSVRTVWPRSFWRQVTPATPVRPRRVVLYWAAATAPLVALIVLLVAVDTVGLARSFRVYRTEYLPVPGRPGLYFSKVNGNAESAGDLDYFWPSPWTAAFVARERYRYPDQPTAVVGPVVAVAAAWPWLTLAALSLFPASLRRARAGRPHVLRAAVYGCDFGLLTFAVALACAGLALWTGVAWQPPWAGWGLVARGLVPAVLTAVACGALATYRLTIACQRYLHVDRPLLTAATTQALLLLAVVAGLLWMARTF